MPSPDGLRFAIVVFTSEVFILDLYRTFGLQPVTVSAAHRPHTALCCTEVSSVPLSLIHISIGALTPPFGATMYQCCNLCEIEMPDFLKQGKELIAALLIALLVVTFVPGIATLLPAIMK